MKTHICYLLVVFVFAACSRYPAEVEHALKLAGDNRNELEIVLSHYRKHPENKLKLQSAYFLIANMPYHFTVHDKRLESFKTYINENEINESFLTTFEKAHGPVSGEREIRLDLNSITSEYLIRNIDFSFQIWQESPWGKYYSFDDFCEHILPYRISHEPLEYWKEEYYNFLRPIIDTMAYCNPDELSIELLKHIESQGWNYESNIHCQGLGATILLKKRFGNCKEIAEFVAYILKAAGIPSGIDCFIQSPDFDTVSHFWNFRYNTKREWIKYDFYETTQLANGRQRARQIGKAYRICFALQKESFAVRNIGQYVPSGGLNDILLKDISNEYFPDTHITVDLEPNVVYSRKDLVYLCVFNNRDWIPIAWSKPKNGVSVFPNVESGILYQVRLINGIQNIAASKPFILLSNEKARYFHADTADLQIMKLYRKFRVRFELPTWAYRSINGKFQGANLPDFSDSVTLHTIQNSADMSYVDVIPEEIGKFKYVRYLSAENGYNNMAEVQFFSEGKLLRGKITGTDSSKDVFPNSDKYSVFDDDPLTFFDALEPNGAWAGLQLDKAYHIDAIRYIFRNDDNNIRPGDEYELFYNSNGQWFSAGHQTADTTVLNFEKVPANTLYWLHNHSRGKEERPFTYENGKQIWW